MVFLVHQFSRFYQSKGSYSNAFISNVQRVVSFDAQKRKYIGISCIVVGGSESC